MLQDRAVVRHLKSGTTLVVATTLEPWQLAGKLMTMLDEPYYSL
jgi:hypothetical protein